MTLDEFKTYKTYNVVNKIENKINHKVYIGQSKNIKHRFHSHIYKCFILNYNHPLYCSIRKYGIQNFTFTIIKKTFDLDLWEVFFTKLYNSADSEYGYNILTGREFPEYLTKEIMTKRKNTYKKRGYIYDAEMLKYLSDIRKGEKNSFYGKHHTTMRLFCFPGRLLGYSLSETLQVPQYHKLKLPAQKFPYQDGSLSRTRKG